MRLVLARWFQVPNTKSTFGTLYRDDEALAMTCEREWKDNLPNVSCVPPGWYSLEPHDGTKYRDTFALRGETVSHGPEEGIQRSTCVFHWSSTGLGLEGCISLGIDLTVVTKRLRLSGASALWETLAMLRADSGPHSLEIVETELPA